MKSTLYQLKDHELKGGLEAYLIEARKAGLSYKKISEELSMLGAHVGRTAVEDWVKALPKPARRKKINENK
jgi:transposase-like protein